MPRQQQPRYQRGQKIGGRYTGQTLSPLRQQHFEAPIPLLNGDFPVEVGPILEGCLGKECSARFARPDLLLTELSRLYETQTGKTLPEVTGKEFTATDYSNRGLTYGYLEQHERAIQDFDRAINIDPNFAAAWMSKGATLANQGDLTAALPCIEKAAALGDALGVQYASMIRQTLGEVSPNNPQAAFEAFQIAESLDEMRQVAQQYPILAQTEFQQKLMWLRRSIKE